MWTRLILINDRQETMLGFFILETFLLQEHEMLRQLLGVFCTTVGASGIALLSLVHFSSHPDPIFFTAVCLLLGASPIPVLSNCHSRPSDYLQ